MKSGTDTSHHVTSFSCNRIHNKKRTWRKLLSFILVFYYLTSYNGHLLLKKHIFYITFSFFFRGGMRKVSYIQRF